MLRRHSLVGARMREEPNEAEAGASADAGVCRGGGCGECLARIESSGASSPGAYGHGNLISTGALRTFSFSVTTDGDGTVTGHFNVYNRGPDVRLFVDIDCATFLPGVAPS